MIAFKAFVEIPIGSGVKYEVDESTGDLTVDRFLYTAFRYPFNYGYIKGTLGGDGDALDVVILSSESVVPGVVMPCHPIGVLETEDENGVDAKIHYPIPMHLQKAAGYLGYKEGDFPEAERQAKRIITLPVHQHLRSEQVRYMIDCVAEFYHAR